ncbi:hypothetical protein AB0K60_34250 [Thermopolyspora sp. NPDC052614]|uniref:hypothetical protein n=1 Tax=Thermopolyspora sp. NPDC052614 TaxID=3155682 RepID=UPI00341E0C54
MGYPGYQAPRQPPYQPNEPPAGAGHRPTGPTGGFQAFQPYGAPGSFGAPGPAQRPAAYEQAGQPQPSPGSPSPGSSSEERPAWLTPEVVLPPPRSRRRPLLLAVGTVVVLAAAGGGLYYAAQRGTQSPDAAAASPTAAPATDSARPGGKYGYAASRATDPLPLQQAELFPKAKIKSGKRTYLMTARRNDKTCKNAAEGSKIQKALKAAGCTQIVRASFQDASGKIIGTVGVANLKTSAGARKVASAGAAKERKDYVKPLQGKKGATKFLGNGEALAGVWTHGHYAVLLWFQFKDGHKPTAAETKRLNLAAGDITDKTVFPALDTRALTGGRG